ncbi:acetyl/propionyl/methylcrotonyl-CoA carboxylase subunit alpha [Jiella sp. MQZ9-1]|uniref:Acetyl/propionyl/methylcrotonyl-CoA carboxylase subunit alpha n=1 Tax=Jiella flava TaxID=2816857 RepID=A0A939FYK9_9HYPH|nr:acetyl/propionyl/methylcrotonyl-CoA carboxylase subunit alpha [Jiella flava]MBO0661907.1 acetyl/propionyl/methylcrotonyl-CoA carboxylase subunit alpha [Jiella flava]MCD2470765.1 acetyl/propionyl/methylcrotonyl-CoA carboxylase subunit alpha [Jiella flava]
MFTKLLIANRGEIACRIIKTTRRMGMTTVAVYSEADRNARHVRLADEGVFIGSSPARDSYLDIAKVIAAAVQSGAAAVHPGYGFLSENEDFATACAEAGLIFVGPPPSAIRAMGSKSAAKALMDKAGVPLTPGYHGDEQDPAFLATEADRIGYPVLIKASAGGGGKGMRRVDRPDDFRDALDSCKREAVNAFGSDHVLIEKYVLRPRHIEIQVFADTLGNCVHLFERDCSVQRRHQKVLEEAPAPHMTPERRAAMGKAAVEAARAVGYVGAGTVEFIVDSSGAFYFMEMNTRLQVEHPVTEMITGVDLVEWQLHVAAGKSLPLTQEQLTISGHAIEARIYAEDPDSGFLPATGRLVHLAPPPETAHLRVDTGVEQGDDITPFYDPMIAKLIVHGDSREQALARMKAALFQFRIVGLRNNVPFLARLVQCASFAAADLDTGLIERENAALFPPASETVPDEPFALAALAELLDSRSFEHRADPWMRSDGWRMNAASRRQFRLTSAATERAVEARPAADGWTLTIDGRRIDARGQMGRDANLRAELDGRSLKAVIVADGATRHVFFDGTAYAVTHVASHRPAAGEDAAHGQLRAPMPGQIVAHLVATDTLVEKGTKLLVMEAMKMEHTLEAPARGRVRAFLCDAGEQVASGLELIQFEPEQ